jgi:hypothetical protein
MDRENSDFGPSPCVDTRPEAGGKELNSKANPPVGFPGKHSFPDQALLGGQPGECVAVVHTHGSAHGKNGVEASPVGEWLPFVDFNPVDGSAFLHQDILVDARGFASDMLKN